MSARQHFPAARARELTVSFSSRRFSLRGSTLSSRFHRLPADGSGPGSPSSAPFTGFEGLGPGFVLADMGRSVRVLLSIICVQLAAGFSTGPDVQGTEHREPGSNGVVLL